MKLYVSGAMTGMPEFNFPAFNRAAEQLRLLGYEVENPADKGIIDGWTWSDYLRYDLKALMDCQGVAMLPGWPGSKGARLEFHVATELGMPCLSVETWVRRSGK